jgi:hypothetical protein
VQGAGVEALDQGHVVVREEGPEQPGDELRRRVGDVGVEERHHVAPGGREGGGHGTPLPAGAAGAPHDPGTGVARLLGRIVGGAVVDHDHLVDQTVAAVLGQERLDDRSHDRADRRGLVAGRDAHRDGAPGRRLGPCDQVGGEVPVVVGLRHAPDSSSHRDRRCVEPARPGR